jgi:hypothetical protein
MDYKKQATDFIAKTGATLKVTFKEFERYFDDDKEPRDIWRFTIQRNGKSYTSRFGQSIVNRGIEPTAYDILSVLTKYEPDTFENFCGDYGYDTDSRRAEKTYKAVVKEWEGVSRLFADVIEQLAEIA